MEGPEIVQAAARACVAHIQAMGYRKGHKRDTLAVAFLLGFARGLEMSGQSTGDLHTWIVCFVALDGYEVVKAEVVDNLKVAELP